MVTVDIRGTVLLPDGQTRVNGATVYIADDAMLRTFQLSENLGCAKPSQSYSEVSCTDDLGTFVLANLEPDYYQIQIERGAFKTTFQVDATASQGEFDLGSIVLEQPDGSAAATMALVTGDFDYMENVLAKSGLGELDSSGRLILGSEQFDIFDGNGELAGDYPRFAALFENNPNTGTVTIYDYDIVFINCGVIEDSIDDIGVAPDDERVTTILRDYVQKGGRLYATDWSYDYIEQAFPEFLDFYGDGSQASQPEQLNAAEVGEPGIILENAPILDNDLKTFLANSVCSDHPDGSCLSINGGLYIEGFSPGWAILEGAHKNASGVRLYTQGEVSTDYGETFVKPLTASFAFGAGYVFYSSYHAEDRHSEGLLPQERVLQYLIFE